MPSHFITRRFGIKILLLSLALTVVVLLPRDAAANTPEIGPDLSPLKTWLAAQKDIHSVSADFIQTRALKTLKSPISIKGHFWLEAPDQFRWQLGDPPKTIIIGNSSGIMIVQPFRKLAQKKLPSPSGLFFNPASLGMMGFTGNRSLEEFQNQMRVLSLKTTGTRCHMKMLPKDQGAVRELASINLDFDTASGKWYSFEIITQEGSSLHTEFNNVLLNPKLEPGLFDYDLGGFKVTDEKN